MELSGSPDFYIIICLVLCTNFVFMALIVYSFIRYNKLAKASLKDKHVVVTGGSSGIGKSLACEAARRGANVTIIARDQNKLKAAKQEILQECKSRTQMVYTLSLDVSSNYNEIEKAMIDLEKEFGPIYMLVNCAGAAICGKLEDTTAADIKKLFELNTLGTIFPTKAVVESMKSRGNGIIVVTASQAAFLGIYGFAAYSSSKFALRGFAESLHMEVLAHGLSVTISFPPDTDTPGFAKEEKTKPKETRMISQTAGLYSPDDIAKKTLDDALAGVYYSSVGLEGFMLCTLCAGMSPTNSLFNLFVQVFLMGPMRFISAFYLASFRHIIKTCLQEKNKSKKAR